MVTVGDLLEAYAIEKSKVEELQRQVAALSAPDLHKAIETEDPEEIRKVIRVLPMGAIRGNKLAYNIYLEGLAESHPEAFVTECYVYGLVDEYIFWEAGRIRGMEPGPARGRDVSKLGIFCRTHGKRCPID
jgi:hypothetical protein